MITEHYLEHAGDDRLFRLAVHGSAVLDVLTDEATLEACRALLRDAPEEAMRDLRMGSFGPFAVTLVVNGGDATAALLIDGPELDDRFQGNQAAGLYLDREELLAVLEVYAPALPLQLHFTTTSVPVQAEGTIAGRPFFFRARHDEWTFSIAEAPDVDPVAIDSAESAEGRGWFRTASVGRPQESRASFLSRDEATAIIRHCAREYLAERAESR